jgi:hypothetical protein
MNRSLYIFNLKIELFPVGVGCVTYEMTAPTYTS